MSDSGSEASPPPDDEEALKKRLLTRIALAGVVVVALLGGLAVFDAMVVSPPSRETVARAPEPTPPAEAKATEAKVEPKVEVPVAEPAPPEPPKAELPSVPEYTASTSAPSAAPGRPQKSLTPPATARPAMIKPQPLAGTRPEIGRDVPRPPPTAAVPLSRPLSQAVQSSRQFVLQMGVFSNLANAEELRAKLELNGIPAQIEARVQVGPFQTKVEAEAARDRLRAIGMDNGILTAVRK